MVSVDILVTDFQVATRYTDSENKLMGLIHTDVTNSIDQRDISTETGGMQRRSVGRLPIRGYF